MTSPSRLWLDHLPDSAKALIDAVSITALLASLVSMLPAIATLLTIIWTAIRIYESATVQGWVQGWIGGKGSDHDAG